MSEPPACLVVSVLPRGVPFGDSALVALDGRSLERLAVRAFPPDEYLCDPESGMPGEVPHCRGLAQIDGNLLVALFNSVREYEVEDIRRLRLRPGTTMSDSSAVDLHGIEQFDGGISAASTGCDSIVSWDLERRRATVAALQPANGAGDLRFPRRLAREAGCDDWRTVLPGGLHVNGVSHLDDGSLLVLSLTRVLRIADGVVRLIVEDTQAKMHDGNPAQGRELLLTDAARGAVVILDLDSGERRFIRVSDPDLWFVRGLAVDGRRAYVLRSEVLASRQRGPAPPTEPHGRSGLGGCFGVTEVDLGAGVPVAEREVELPTMARGTVAYDVLAWNGPV